jgi:hypothetical protein
MAVHHAFLNISRAKVQHHPFLAVYKIISPSQQYNNRAAPERCDMVG